MTAHRLEHEKKETTYVSDNHTHSRKLRHDEKLVLFSSEVG